MDLRSRALIANDSTERAITGQPLRCRLRGSTWQVVLLGRRQGKGLHAPNVCGHALQLVATTEHIECVLECDQTLEV